ncbi:MAG TPA: hypothetical protein VGU01_05630 [Sphingomicrobium sp.]|nr:hypothetical protein [Sphingomicrobium sp.]
MRPLAGAPASGKSVSILPLIVAALLIPAVLGSLKAILNDGDVSWHIATGQWIIAHQAIPRADPFSFTWAGKPWVPIEWLAELIYAVAFRLAGYGGVAAVVTAALIGLHAIVYSNARRWLGTDLLPIVAMDFALVPMLSARPHVLTWPLLALWTSLMLKARDTDRAPPLPAALLMTVWANLHGSFVFGFLIAGVFGLEAALKSRRRNEAFRAWLFFGLFCVAAVFINGNGVSGVLHPLRFTQLKMLPLIDEWKPSSPASTPFFFSVLLVILILAVWIRPRLPWTRWLLLFGLLVLAIVQVRHQAMFAIVAAMVLPQGFAQRARPPAPSRGSLAYATAAAAVFIVALRALVPFVPPDNAANPWNLIASVPASLRTEPVFNDYSMGGALILSGIRPFIDGRGDMYGDALVLGYARIAGGDPKALADAVSRWRIRWAILPNGSKLVPVLDRTPGWRELRRDKVGIIYIRSANA